MRQIFFVLLIATAGSFTHSQEWGKEYFEWMEMITESCQKTTTGKMKRMFQTDKEYFSDVWISMGMYKLIYNELRNDVYGHCRNGSRSQLEFASCTARFQKNRDWFRRCLPIVEARMRGFR